MDQEIERMFISVGADVRSAVASLDTLNAAVNRVEQNVNRASNVWGGFMGGLAKVGLAINGVQQIIGLGEGIIHTFTDLALVAAQADQQMDILRHNIENTGVTLSEKMNKKLEENVHLMMKAGAFTEGELVPAYSTLVAITGNYKEATDRMALAEDFARGAHLELSTAARLLGKVTDETTTVLARYGIRVEKGATATELLRKVQQRFGGDAATYIKGPMGQWDLLNIKMEEGRKNLSEKLQPAFMKFMQLQSTLMDAFGEKFGEWTPAITQFFEDLEKAITQVLHGLGAIGEMFEVLSRSGRKDAGGELTSFMLGSGDKAGVAHAKDLMTSLGNIGKGFTGEAIDKNNPLTQFGDSLKTTSDALSAFGGILRGINEKWEAVFGKPNSATGEAHPLTNPIAIGIVNLGNSIHEFSKNFHAAGELSADDPRIQVSVTNVNHFDSAGSPDVVRTLTGDLLDATTEALRQQARRVGLRSGII